MDSTPFSYAFLLKMIWDTVWSSLFVLLNTSNQKLHWLLIGTQLIVFLYIDIYYAAWETNQANYSKIHQVKVVE